MKHLSLFRKFDDVAFLKGKTIMTTGCLPWDEYGSNKHLGTKVIGVITKDNTDYQGREGNNRFEKLTFKVPKDISIPEDSYIVPVNPVCKVYGEYNNFLSITCDDIKIITKGGNN